MHLAPSKEIFLLLKSIMIYFPHTQVSMRANQGTLKLYEGSSVSRVVSEQLAVGLKIISNCYKSRVQAAEIEIRQLKTQLAERGEQVRLWCGMRETRCSHKEQHRCVPT